ncbi:uncharacterized protein LOC126901005 [Daktulosphaira vitifoliae]|uniref:uncharacterized protein LOC126901005 n=1 Tax=Daktulosphaira vitifoliae TaxID=58002 RepID=UPI0021AAF866|nr:uncharacterized protein LOC126901005 [Daktulosphaira vitifoliae]
MRHALDLLLEIKIIVASLTYDGCSTNLSTSQNLGCSFDVDKLNIKLTSCTKNNANAEIVVLLDDVHMIKLVRNSFSEQKIFIDKDDITIDFNFIFELFILQEQEGCHLANKLRKSHIYYFKQKMKVKLTTQLLSQSVADALRFCKYNLNLENFSDVDATIKFIEIFNNALYTTFQG